MRLGWTLLDVRTQEEWAEARIPEAMHIPMSDLMARLDEIDGPVICVCAVGGRSARVTDFLNARGREAVNLEGGLVGWAAAGLPLMTPK